jgi:integrase/recombinase XerD
MTFQLLYQPAAPGSASPYRVVDGEGQEVAWANDFLDLQRVRGLSLLTLQAYGVDLLHFARWWVQQGGPDWSQFSETTVLDYLKAQLDTKPPATVGTINRRLSTLRRLFRFHMHCQIPYGRFPLQAYYRRDPLGYGGIRIQVAQLRLRQPRRVVVPLTAQEVARFWDSLHTCRDLALVGLMLFDGLRSSELLGLQLEDLSLAESQMRVSGKGSKVRVLPLPPETIHMLEQYLQVERPLTNSPYLFVSLKGRARGLRMNRAGLRSLFRHHRKTSEVARGNPHRFRHTFAAEMVRAGISLPALMHLMGHAQIHTTMLYVQLGPEDVWREFAAAVARRPPLPREPRP